MNAPFFYVGHVVDDYLERSRDRVLEASERYPDRQACRYMRRDGRGIAPLRCSRESAGERVSSLVSKPSAR